MNSTNNSKMNVRIGANKISMIASITGCETKG